VKPAIGAATAAFLIFGQPAAADTWGHKSGPESRVQSVIDSMRQDAFLLRGVMEKMPKGGDLHSHTSGAIDMDKLIRWGGEDGACVDTATVVANNPCKSGNRPMVEARVDRALYNLMWQGWSMAAFGGTLLEAHQHFFDAFGKFGAVLTDARSDDGLADILSTAGRNNQIYVELMQGFGSSAVAAVASKYIKPGDPWTEEYLLQKRREIMADPVFARTLNAIAPTIEQTVVGARALLGCDTVLPDPGCKVEPRFILAANRTGDRGRVFAQWVFGFELAQAAPKLVGVNLVSPEEHPNSLLYYDDEMFAVDVLRRFNDADPGRRKVHVGLHAGELIPEILPPTEEGQRHLTFHMRHAVDIAHAERIGHGADVLREERADSRDLDLFRSLKRNNVLIEICLTSNATLLGQVGKTHPLRKYVRHHVPVALATDDQGILLNDITQEYARAVTEHKLSYPTLKDMVRASLAHGFLPGADLWRKPNRYDQPVAACRRDNPLKAAPSAGCAAFLAGSERAALQWKLEGQLRSFEREMGKVASN
jgi:adenosine deaminase